MKLQRLAKREVNEAEESILVHGQILRLQIAIFILIDTVRPAAQSELLLLLSSVTDEQRLTQLTEPERVQVDIVVVDAAVEGHGRVPRLLLLLLQLELLLGQVLRQVSIAGRSRRQVVVGAIVVGRRRIVVVVVVLGVEERHDVVLLAERPPPAEADQAGQFESGRTPGAAAAAAAAAGAGVGRGLEFLDERNDRLERLVGASVVRHDGRFAAEIQHGFLVVSFERHFVEHEHPLRLAQDVVVQRPFRDSVVRRCLRETHPLSHDRLDRLLQLLFRPRRSFRTPLHERFCVCLFVFFFGRVNVRKRGQGRVKVA